jgi:heptaprenyl diphosphate synthase
VGEMLQYQRRYRVDRSIKNYLKVISGKTAALFAISLAAGAYESGADEKTAKTLGRIGYNIGMAFQIIDDLLDYNGDAKSFGKDTRADLLKGYYTLPIIRSLGTKDGREIEGILAKADLSEKDIENLIGLTKHSGSIDDTQKLAMKYTQRALKNLAKLPECEAKDILQEIIPIMLKRKK